MKLSIVIPAYNEEKRILPTLEDYHSFFQKKLKDNFEIIVVPNNCSDKTFEVVKDFVDNKKQIRVFNLPNYSGKGGAVLKGFELARGDLIGFADADDSVDAENFYKLYKNINCYDGIIASRKIKGAKIFPKRSFFQEFSSNVFSKIANVLINLEFKDTQCGGKIFTKKTVNILADNYSEVGWIFDVDILCICKNNRLKIKEFPINWHDATGSVLTFKDKIVSLFELLRYRFK